MYRVYRTGKSGCVYFVLGHSVFVTLCLVKAELDQPTTLSVEVGRVSMLESSTRGDGRVRTKLSDERQGTVSVPNPQT